MQWNRALLREIENTNQPSFIPTEIRRAHKGIAQAFKYKAKHKNAVDIDSAMNSMHDTLHNLIRNNRNNTTQKISIGITEHFSKPKEVLNDRDLVDPLIGIIHKKVQFQPMKRFMMINITTVMFSLYTLGQVLENY